MQEEKQEEKQDLLFYDLPLPRLLAWNRWWHLTAKTVLLVYKKRTWGVIGPYLKSKKGVDTDRIVLLRTNWSARGRRGLSQNKLASEAYRAIQGVARNSIANRDTMGH